jgi:RNA polymerase sigma factor (sigma-70 family)
MTSPARANAPLPSDGDLVAAIAGGNLEALGALFDRYAPLVRRYLGRLGVSASDADDLVQATFLEVVRAASRFDPSYAARSWLLGIATVMARRHRRSIARAVARIAAWAERSRTESESPVAAFEAGDTMRRVQRAFAHLSPKKREVLVLITLENLSGEEVAEALGIPTNTVWTRLHHARRDLRALLGEGEA